MDRVSSKGHVVTYGQAQIKLQWVEYFFFKTKILFLRRNERYLKSCSNDSSDQFRGLLCGLEVGVSIADEWEGQIDMPSLTIQHLNGVGIINIHSESKDRNERI